MGKDAWHFSPFFDDLNCKLTFTSQTLDKLLNQFH
jgi:hypothetical protein